jgi:hypothetical protein
VQTPKGVERVPLPSFIVKVPHDAAVAPVVAGGGNNADRALLAPGLPVPASSTQVPAGAGRLRSYSK